MIFFVMRDETVDLLETIGILDELQFVGYFLLITKILAIK